MQKEDNYIFGVDESKKNDADYRVVLSGDEVLDMGKDISDRECMAEEILALP